MYILYRKRKIFIPVAIRDSYMQRKIIQPGQSTFLVSLPRSWCLEQGMKRGDVIDVRVKGDTLELATQRAEKQPSEIVINITGLDRTSIFYVLRSAYRQGYDIIKVKFDNKTTIHYRTEQKVLVASLLHQELQRWIGMQIIEQKENYFVYKTITKPSFEELDIMLRRAFLLLIDAAESFVKAIEQGDALQLETMDDSFYNIIIFIAYCQRLINKIGLQEKYKNAPLYVILANLNKIGDVLRYGARDAIKLKRKAQPRTVKILRDIFALVRYYYELFYKFDFDKFTWVYRQRDTTLRQIELVRKVIPIEEVMLLVYCRQVLDITTSNLEAAATYYLNEKPS